MSKKNIILFAGILIIIPLIIFLFNFYEIDKFIGSKTLQNNNNQEPAEVTLEFWGTWDNSDSWEEIINKFEEQEHIWNGQKVKVKVNYTKKDFASYENNIEQAYAENKSPSIFMINNYWLERYVNKLEPLTGNAAYVTEYNLLNYEKLGEIFPPYTLQEAFYQNNEMYAVPIYSDSLALYYNKDLFQKAGIETPPTTWDELKSDVKKLTILEKNNKIKQSGIALGGGNGINRSCDILSLLMLQGGAKIIDDNSNIDFNKKISINTAQGTQEREPGLTGIQFYMEFSDPDKEIYTWNNELTNSIQDFAAGKTAMMLNYSYQKANLLALKPELNYGIAPIPQIPNSTPINISNVWFPVVSNQSSCSIKGNKQYIDCSKIAWSFLSFASQKENIVSYLKATDRASARIDLIQEQSEQNDAISVFAKQATMARSYYKFNDKIDTILIDMLNQIYSNRKDWKTAADTAAAKIEELKNKTNE